MRVLVLGGDGLLGGELVRRLVRDHDVTVTVAVRATAPSCPPPADRVLTGVDVRRRDTMVDAVRPDAVVNSVGLVGRRAEGREEGVPDPVDVHGMTKLLGEVRNRALSARRLRSVTGSGRPGGRRWSTSWRPRSNGVTSKAPPGAARRLVPARSEAPAPPSPPRTECTPMPDRNLDEHGSGNRPPHQPWSAEPVDPLR
ncbi:NAD-dependent epimerase/dehydratase family protein [Parafrankia sp. FMc6]|uniref:NAD-dependent epimerase/dehydratase family protein n=1 Tax=Parafrankia soli TaxID=2599596 RepID=UPI0034D42C67